MVLQSIGTYFGFGPQRNLNLNKEAEKQNKKRVERDLTNLAKAYGGLENVPDSLKPIENITQSGGITRLDPRFKVKGVGKGEELRLLPGSEKFGREGKYYVSKKDAPKLGGLGDTLGGIADAVLFQSTDFDRKGSDFGAKPKIIDINDPSNYLVSQAQQSQVLGGLEQAGVDVGGASSPTAGIKEQLELIRGQGGDDLIDFYSKAGKRAAGDAFKQYALTEPVRQMFANRAGNIATQRFLDAQGVLEQMPSAVQDIMTKKQRQILESQVGAAEMAKATADQQDAATRMAGLGMQRQFGQNVVYTPPLLRG
jgi:hypothetical protein